jgi:hypothetical protein
LIIIYDEEHYSRVKAPQVFYVPRVEDDPTVLVSDLDCPRLEQLIDDDRPVPWGHELVLVLIALDSSKY